MIKTAWTFKINFALILTVLFLLLPITNAKSQTVQYDSVSKQKYIQVDIHKTYERIIDKGYESIEMFESLGNYYYECNNFKKSKLYFDKLFGKYNLSQISSKSIERYKMIAK